MKTITFTVEVEYDDATAAKLGISQDESAGQVASYLTQVFEDDEWFSEYSDARVTRIDVGAQS